MDVNYQVIHAKDFIKSTVHGEVDLERSIELLKTIASSEKPPSEYEILIDFREAEINASLLDVFELANELSRHKFGMGRKIAVLTSKEKSDEERQAFFRLCAKNRGINVRHFVRFEEALEWLNVVEEFG